MKFSQEELERKAEEAMRSCLEGIPSVKIVGVEKDRDFNGNRADFVTTVNTPAGTRYLVADVKTVGQPRVAREAINRLRRCRENAPDVVPVFIAPYVSPRAGEICKKEEIGYADLAGNCRIFMDTIFIEREGKPNPFSEKRDLRSLYSPKSSRVLRVLLANPGISWKVQDLAEEAGVSLGLVANVKKILEDREWVRKTDKGPILQEPEKLLTEWAESYSPGRNRVRHFFSLESMVDLEAGVAIECLERKLRYALTGLSGYGSLVQRVQSSRMMAYVENLPDEVIVSLGLKEVTSGANVTLMEPFDAGVFYGAKETGEVCVASPVQVYLDLKGIGEEGEEAAGQLLDEVIRAQW